MTIESFQDTLFEDPIGLRFRHAREKARLSQEAVAQKLKLPVAVLDAIEREDWARLGAPIFARSYIGSYAKLLGLPASLAEEVVRGKPAPQLAAIGGGSPTRQVFDRSVMNIAYLVMTVVIVGSVIMLAMYFQGPRRSAEVLPLDSPSILAVPQAPETANSSNEPLDATLPATDTRAMGGSAAFAGSEPMAVGSGNASEGADSVLETATDSPVMASLAPSLPIASRSNDEIVLRFNGSSWIDIVDRNGIHIERGLVAAGTERRFAAGRLAQVTLGDATAVEVRASGVALDLTPYREANVAHFTVSSTGEILPSAGN